MTTFERMRHPPSSEITSPTEEMLRHVSMAEKHLKEGAGGSGVLQALEKARGGLVGNRAWPDEWSLMRAEAYLRDGSPREARRVVQPLLASACHPRAFVLCGRAHYGLSHCPRIMCKVGGRHAVVEAVLHLFSRDRDAAEGVQQAELELAKNRVT